MKRKQTILDILKALKNDINFAFHGGAVSEDIFINYIEDIKELVEEISEFYPNEEEAQKMYSQHLKNRPNDK